MRKIIVSGLMILVLLTLTACGGNDQAVVEEEAAELSQSEASESVDDADNSEEQQSQEKSRDQLRADFAENALSEEMQLVVGTMMLEGTDLEVDAPLAEILIPYWKLYLNLLDSDTTSAEELVALIDGIQDEMSPEQISYISGLELTQEDMFTAMGEFGIMENMGPGRGADDGDENMPDFPQGDMPEGMGPGGGQGRGAGQGPGGGEGMMDPELRETMEARGDEMGAPEGMGANRSLEPFINALIELLESKLES